MRWPDEARREVLRRYAAGESAAAIASAMGVRVQAVWGVILWDRRQRDPLRHQPTERLRAFERMVWWGARALGPDPDSGCYRRLVDEAIRLAREGAV